MYPNHHAEPKFALQVKTSFKPGNTVPEQPTMDPHVAENQGCVLHAYAIDSQDSKNEEKWDFKRQLGLLILE